MPRIVPSLLPSLILGLTCSACVYKGVNHSVDLGEIAAQHDRDMADFHRAQAALERREAVPQRHDFGDAGSVLIDRIALVGRPGKAFLRVHFTWVNTTGTDHSAVDVRLTLRDPARDNEWSDTVEMSLPYKYKLTPNSTYTSWFETPMYGLHLREGWEWELHVRPRKPTVLAQE